jgi:protein SCO1/2
MANSPRQFPRTFWLGSGLLFGLLGLGYLTALVEMKKERQNVLPILGQIADFNLTNQLGQATALGDLTNHVWLADIIFTRCPGPCARMSRQMKSLQDLIPPTSTAKLVSLTTDPVFDTPPVLEKYSERNLADTNRWIFLTGTKNEIAALASDSLKLSAVPIKPEERKGDFDLFIHTTIFVIVDKHARLRGLFETGGDGVDWAVIQPRIISTIHELETEP